MSTLGRGVSSDAIDTDYISRSAIKALENKLQLAHLATPGDLPHNEGSTLTWQLDVNIVGPATATDALVGSASDIVYATRDSKNEDAYLPTSISKQLSVYGTFVPVRTRDLESMPKGMMDRLAKRLAYRGSLTIDTLLRAVIDGTGSAFDPVQGSGTTTVRIGAGGALGDNANLEDDDFLTAEDIALATGDLWENDAEEYSNGMYAAVIHSVAATHLVTDVSTSRITWEEINKHVSGLTGQEKLINGTIGGITGTMVMRSNNIDDTTQVDAQDAFLNIVTAVDGFGNAAIEDMEPVVYINQPNANSTDNPYRIMATASFVFEAVPTLLDVKRVEVLVTTR